MIEIVAFVAFVLALVAHRSGRKMEVALQGQIDALKLDLQRLQQTGSSAALDDVPVLEESAAETSASAAVTALDATPERDVGEDIVQRREPLTGEMVEKAARGEPVAARSAVLTVTDAVAPRREESLESRLGARWAVWVGGIALALGGIFMVKYSIDAGLLSPAVRLSMAALFGLVLIAGGEIVRRRAVPLIADGFRNAMIPGILTAAGAVTLFGACYAAHGIYGYIGPATAFVLLALVSLAIVGLSLLHGQALAGLGLLASFATPALVSSQSPSPWSLFGFLVITWYACLFAARLRRWTIVPSLANVGLALWCLVYIASAIPFETLPVTLTMIAMLVGVAFVWPGAAVSRSEPPETAEAASEQNSEPDGQPKGPTDRRPDRKPGAWERLMAPAHAAITVTAAVSASLTALALISPAFAASGHPAFEFMAVVAALAAVGALRGHAVYPALLSAVTSLAGIASMTAMNGIPTIVDPGVSGAAAFISAGTVMATAMILSVVFLALSAVALHLHGRDRREFAIVWAGIAAAVPTGLTGLSFLMTGNLSFDAAHGGFALFAGIGLLVLTDRFSRRGDRSSSAVGFLLLAGAFALFVIALHALTDGVVTTILIAVLGGGAIAAMRVRSWPGLPWMMVASGLVILARIAWEPTIVGAAHLGTTPVFNALLAGYGIPTLILIAGAFALRASPDLRVRNLVQALATLFSLLTLAILVRHAMNGGVLDSAVPTLGEQSIYTLLAIGGSGILMTLDLKSPSPVFRYGGMAVGILSMLSILSAHLIGLNPYFSGERLGPVPFFDLLLIGYLLPGAGYAGLSWYAQGRRPMPYVSALAVSGAVLVFSWATLSVRRFWQGDSIADWKGFLPGETYTYSVVWLLLGVLMLALGSRFNAKSLRIASAVLVFVAVLKVFLIDMANLEGFLRALSFIGLGAVLIGIGLFYQKILSGKAQDERLEEHPDPVVEPEPTEAR